MVNNGKTKKLNISMYSRYVGMTSIEVPDDYTLEQAIAYAKEHIDDIPLPDHGEYVEGQDTIDEDNCDFDDGEELL